METLSRLLSRVKEDCFIDEFLVSERHDARVEVSNLLFANDNLILCDASKENLENPSWVFMWFKACSGLKINLEKSELIPVLWGRIFCFSFLLLWGACLYFLFPFACIRYTSCVLCAPFPNAFNIFALFTYQKKGGGR